MHSTEKPRSNWLMVSIGILLAYTVARALLPEVKLSRSTAGEFGKQAGNGEPLDLQRARANETGRGRRAFQPQQIPLKGWKDIFFRTVKQIQEDRLLAISAGVVFFSLLSIFPALVVAVSLYGIFAEIGTFHDHITILSSTMPGTVVDIVEEQIARIVAKGDVTLSLGFLTGLAIALWSANSGMKALIDALNIVYEEDEKRSFLKLNAVSLLFTIGGVVALLLAIGAVMALPLLFSFLGFGWLTNVLLKLGRWPILYFGLVSALAVLYHYGPSRNRPKWKWVSVGSLVGGLLWIAASAVFSYYLENFADYNATYGSLGAGIGMMMWLWWTIIVILFGAEFNSEIEHQTAVDTTVGMPEPLGERGATMADTVGKAQ
jgi:membrane protein